MTRKYRLKLAKKILIFLIPIEKKYLSRWNLRTNLVFSQHNKDMKAETEFKTVSKLYLFIASVFMVKSEMMNLLFDQIFAEKELDFVTVSKIIRTYKR